MLHQVRFNNDYAQAGGNNYASLAVKKNRHNMQRLTSAPSNEVRRRSVKFIERSLTLTTSEEKTKSKEESGDDSLSRASRITPSQLSKPRVKQPKS